MATSTVAAAAASIGARLRGPLARNHIVSDIASARIRFESSTPPDADASATTDEPWTPHAFPSNSTLYLRDLTDCTVLIADPCVKLLVENCARCRFIVRARVLTRTLDVWRTTDSSFEIGTPVMTIQNDICDSTTYAFSSTADFGIMAWSDSTAVSVTFADAPEAGGTFGLLPEDQDADAAAAAAAERGPHPDVASAAASVDVVQHLVKMDAGRLRSERVIRLAGGYATTSSEDREFVRRRDANLAIIKQHLDAAVGRTQPDRQRARAVAAGTPGGGPRALGAVRGPAAAPAPSPFTRTQLPLSMPTGAPLSSPEPTQQQAQAQPPAATQSPDDVGPSGLEGGAPA